MAFTITTLCTGNICRSPYAALVLKKKLDEIAPGVFTVRSAGIQAMVGKPPARLIQRRLDALGIDTTAHTAQQMTPEVIDASDLVLAMEPIHSTYAVQMAPTAMRRVHLLRSFAEFYAEEAHSADSTVLPRGGSPACIETRWRCLTDLIATQRWRCKSSHNTVIDPFGKSRLEYDQMTQEILGAIQQIIGAEEIFQR